MYGKSYDAVTGLIGVDHRPAGLDAVVAQEPVYDLYRYLYGNGIKRENAAATPALYNLIALTPGPALDTPNYNVGAVESANPGCNVQNGSTRRATTITTPPTGRSATSSRAPRGPTCPSS